MTIWKALLEVQKQAPSLQKDAVNPHFKNKYVSLDKLIETMLPLLSAQGVVLLQSPTTDEVGNPVLRTVLYHAETETSIEETIPLEIQQRTPQAQGSAITYARRYSLMALLGLAADEDDDGQTASAPPPVKHPEPVQDAEFVAPADGNTYKVVSSGIEKVEEPKFQAPTGATEPSITDPQRKNIWRLIKKLVEQGGDEEELKAEVLLAYGVTSTTDLSKKEASEVIEGFKLRAGET